MKAIIEKPFNSELNLDKMIEFNKILKAISFSNSEDDLRQNMIMESRHPLNNYMYFNYGFGAGHMWVHEKEPEFRTYSERERLLIVEF